MSLKDDLHKVFEEVRAEVAKEGTYLAHLLSEVERHFAIATAEPPAPAPEAFEPPVIEEPAEDKDADLESTDDIREEEQDKDNAAAERSEAAAEAKNHTPRRRPR